MLKARHFENEFRFALLALSLNVLGCWWYCGWVDVELRREGS